MAEQQGGAVGGFDPKAAGLQLASAPKGQRTQAVTSVAKDAAVGAARKYAAGATGGLSEVAIAGLRVAKIIAPIVLSLLLILTVGIVLLGATGGGIPGAPTGAAGACTNGVPAPAAPSTGGAGSGGSSAATATVDPVQLQSFLLATRTHESSGDYTAYNAAGGASGAYQYIQPTWTSEANASGNNLYAGGPAGLAAPTVQDAVAAYDATQKYLSLAHFGGNIWKWVAEAWYYPAWAGDPAQQSSVPYPSAGNTLTIGQYGQNILDLMAHPTAVPGAPTTTAPSGGNCAIVGGPLGATIVSVAQGEIGKTLAQGNYAGGRSELWCSDFATWVWQQAGIPIPDLAYSAAPWTWVAAHGGTQLPPTATPQPGDLVLFGTGPTNSEHVAIVTQVLPNGDVATIGGDGPAPGQAWTLSTSVVGRSAPGPMPLTAAAASSSGWPGPVWGYAQPPGL